MNETVIQEIANQLGIAVDQAGIFIQTYLPQYALLCATKTFVTIGLMLICLIALFIVCKKLYSLLHKDDYCEFHEEIIVLFICLTGLTVLLGLVFILHCFIVLPDAVSWLIFPEGQLIDMALNAIK